MEKKYEEIGTYFCFDPKKVPMEEFFGDLAAFMKEFEVCSSGHVMSCDIILGHVTLYLVM